jgi:predicted unusual protein kinase regulating ubiquinone biosynthesis (AarF/ABC1/UbiB family)
MLRSGRSVLCQAKRSRHYLQQRSRHLFHDSAARAGAAFVSGGGLLLLAGADGSRRNNYFDLGYVALVAQCEQQKAAATYSPPETRLVRRLTMQDSAINVGRICRRLVMLVWNFLPVALLSPILWFYPLSSSSSSSGDNNTSNNNSGRNQPMDAHELVLQERSWDDIPGPLLWYLKQCLHAVEASGAVIIKLTQWASSRPDLFGPNFCTILSQLQDKTTPHSQKHTEMVLAETYGKDWQDILQLDEILGSGCIGQVYRGRFINQKNRNNNNDHHTPEPLDVAVKILHPRIEDNIHADLDILRVLAKYLEKRPSLKWLNIPGIVEEFAKLLLSQMDLRIEAANLQTFRRNFADYPKVEFPQVIAAHEKILIESYVEGTPVVEYCRQNREKQEHLTQLCTVAIQCVCKMIFLDNFVHGDMHPVRTKEEHCLAVV